jgi:hypothetical protein
MNSYDFINMYDEITYTSMGLNNRIFCTFSKNEGLETLIYEISTSYTIKYNKIFILSIKDSDEYAVTYNTEQGNVNYIFPNTILVHRKKEYNVLYSINSLNELIKKLNNGIVDTSYQINWQHYKNSILLTDKGNFKQLNTKIYKIIEL